MDEYTHALQGGILIGLASWILLAGVGRASSVSSITVGVLTSRRQRSFWRWAFLFGLVGGGAFFTWALSVPHVQIRNYLVLAPAGLLVGFGAVLGSGSLSGHAMVGLGRRSKRSLVAIATFTGAAVMTVLVTSHLPATGWWAELIMDGLMSLIGRARSS